MKEKRYETIFNLIIMLIGIALLMVGYIIYPMVVLVLVIGIFLFICGLINSIKCMLCK